jgi:hypothetical protein
VIKYGKGYEYGSFKQIYAHYFETRQTRGIEADSGFEFCFDEGCTLSLPLKKFGSIEFLGWDIPKLFAIDNDNTVWLSNGHNDVLTISTASNLLEDIEDGCCSSQTNDLRDVLGLPREIPAWIRLARMNGWTPPLEWDDSKAI